MLYNALLSSLTKLTFDSRGSGYLDSAHRQCL